MRLGQTSVIYFGSKVSASLLGFLSTIYIARQIGADPLGVYYPFVALIGVALLPSDLGIGSAIKKRLSENIDRNEHIGAALAIKFVLVSLVACAVLLASNYVNQFLGADLAIIMVVVLYIDGIGGLSVTILHGELRVGEAAVLEVLRPLGWLISGCIFVFYGYQAEGLVYGYLVGSVIITIVGWWKVSSLPARPQNEHFSSLFDFAKYSAVSSIGGFFYSWMDVLILTLFVTINVRVARGDVGAYENAWRLSIVTMLLARSVSTVLFPQFSEWDAQKAKNKIESTLPTAMFASLLLVVPGFVGILILSDDLLRILYGPEFTVASTALVVLTAGKIPMSIHTLFNKALNGLDRPDLPAIASIVSAIINISLNIILIWNYGLIGAAIATVISFLVNTLMHTFYLKKMININIPFEKISWIGISSAIMGTFVYSLYQLLEPLSPFSMTFLIAMGFCIYSFTMLIPVSTRSELIRLCPDKNKIL
jgi:O-antigen/teichoic acid export membrane protein